MELGSSKARPTCLDWSYDGSLLGLHCYDRRIRIVYPRSNKVTSETKGHRKATKAKLTFLGRNTNYLATSGSDKN